MAHHFAWQTHPTVGLKVDPGFSLPDFDRASTPGWHGDSHDGKAELARRGKGLAELQTRLFAEGKEGGGTRSVLLVLQGMDTSGKGGIVSHVVGLVNPQGVSIRAFGRPSEEEKKHPYLWRIDNSLPAPGKIGVFDRSHYEDVLVVRVHELVAPDVWGARYDEINEWEAKVTASGTVIIKCALLISPEEQLRRLADRLVGPSVFWKYNPHDLDERGHWNAYQDAYQDALVRCSTDVAPWYAIPSDHKWFARLAITELLTSALEALSPQWPEPAFDVEAERERIMDLGNP